jgi:hypothetical protein
MRGWLNAYPEVAASEKRAAKAILSGAPALDPDQWLPATGSCPGCGQIRVLHFREDAAFCARVWICDDCSRSYDE